MMQRNISFWIDYLHALHVRSIDLELGRIQHVAERLHITQPSCPVVTVAGTNGKGSVVAFLEALYTRAGYKVAAYTSPYLIAFNEQFRCNQQWIEDELLCDYFEKINVARGDVTLTLFEVKTLAALLYFADMKPDIMLLEVGLGGRLDSVNMIDPDIAVITSISLDHCDWLGDTRELIGREKAGIFRPGKFAVCGDLNPPHSIDTVAQKLGAVVFYRDKDFYITTEQDTWSWHGKSRVLKNLPQPYLLHDNIATALQVVELLSASFHHLSAGLCDTLIRDTIALTRVPGRQQIISQQPFIVVDVSHNEDSVCRLVEFLQQHQQHSMTAVFSALKTKNITRMVQVISPYVTAWHIAQINHADAMPLLQLQKVLQQLQRGAVVTHASITAAYHAVCQSSTAAIVVFGSFHVAGEVLSMPA